MGLVCRRRATQHRRCRACHPAVPQTLDMVVEYPALSPWGPIALVLWLLISRYQRRVRFLQQSGISGRATVRSITATGSSLNGCPVLRLSLSVQIPDRPAYETSVRTAPPYHLAGMLR